MQLSQICVFLLTNDSKIMFNVKKRTVVEIIMPGLLDLELDEKYAPLLDIDVEQPANSVTEVRIDPKAALAKAAPYPEKYQFKLRSHQTYGAAFSIVCASAGSVLYIGAGGNDIVKIVGGTGVNLPANINFAYESYFYLKDSLKNIKHQKAKFVGSMFTAIITTTPSTIAAAQFEPVISHIADPCFMAIGSFPINFYGAFAPFNIASEYFRNKPSARKHLLKEMLQITERERHIYTKLLGPALGLPMGTALMGSQTGYIYATSNFLGDNLGFGSFAFTSGVIANSPSLILGLFGGLTLGSQIADAFDDMIHTSPAKLFRSLRKINARDMKYIVNTAIICSAFMYLAYESNQTSVSLYEKQFIQKGYSFGETIDDLLLFCVKYSTCAFNALYAIKPIIQSAIHLHRSRAPEADRVQYEKDIQIEWINSAPINNVLPIAEAAGWEKPPRKSWCGFFRKDQSDYQQLASEPAEANQKKSICLVM